MEGIIYRRSDGALPQVREREGQVISPGLVLNVAQKAFSGGQEHDLKSLCQMVAAQEGCTLTADSDDLTAAVDTLVRRWHGAGWLAGKTADGKPAAAKKPSGGRKRASSKALPDTERITAPVGAIITWLTGQDGDEDRTEIRHTLARNEDILVSVVSPAVVCGHIFDVLISAPQTAKTCKCYAVAGSLQQLVTGTHQTHEASADTIREIRALASVGDDKLADALLALDLDAIATAKDAGEEEEEAEQAA